MTEKRISVEYPFKTGQHNPISGVGIKFETFHSQQFEKGGAPVFYQMALDFIGFSGHFIAR
jgi:hypothetical protein